MKAATPCHARTAPTDGELLEQLDDLVAKAAGGDGRAVGAIAIAFGPMLLAEARHALRRREHHRAPDAVQELMVSLLERRLTAPRTRGAAIPWMKRMTRLFASQPPGFRRPARSGPSKAPP